MPSYLLKRRLADHVFKSADLGLRGLRRREPGLAPPVTWRAFIGDLPRPALEIGPFDRPCLSGEGVSYFDVLDQDGLRQRASQIPGRDPGGCPYIDYVSGRAELAVVDRTFMSVLSSHSLEHQTDLIGHLSSIRTILDPAGAYYLIVPDKRFCFDHFLPESRLEEVLDARGRQRHTPDKIREHLTAKTHNSSVLHWLGYHGRPKRSDMGLNEAMAAHHRGDYVDVHAWQFTPASFRTVVGSLAAETGLRIDRVHDTMFGSIEFMAVLRPVGA